MKVKIVSLGRQSGGVTLGKIYNVIEVYLYRTRVSFRVFGDKGSVPLVDIDCLIVVEPSMGFMHFHHKGDEGVVLRPAFAMVDGFWERYVDGAPEEREKVGALCNSLLMGK